jgi:hypothetical protein
MNRIKEQYDGQLEQANGAYFALNLAHMHMENRVKTIQNKYEKEFVEHKDLIVRHGGDYSLIYVL